MLKGPQGERSTTAHMVLIMMVTNMAMVMMMTSRAMMAA
jgi:hypothetical protein